MQNRENGRIGRSSGHKAVILEAKKSVTEALRRLSKAANDVFSQYFTPSAACEMMKKPRNLAKSIG